MTYHVAWNLQRFTEENSMQPSVGVRDRLDTEDNDDIRVNVRNERTKRQVGMEFWNGKKKRQKYFDN